MTCNSCDDEEIKKIGTIGVKFSNDVFIPPNLLDKWGVKYEEKDLEDGPWGKVLRIKNDKKDN